MFDTRVPASRQKAPNKAQRLRRAWAEPMRLRFSPRRADGGASDVPENSKQQSPDTGYRIPDTGYRIPDTGYRIPDTGYRIPDTEL